MYTTLKINHDYYVIKQNVMVNEDEYFELDGELLCNCSRLTDMFCEVPQNKVVAKFRWKPF